MDALTHKPWLDEPLYGGMSPAAAEASWRAAQARREADEAWWRGLESPRANPSLPNGPEDCGLSPHAGIIPVSAPFSTITPVAWKGTESTPQRWLARERIPSGDLTLYSGNGGAGKTETAVQLLVSVAAELGDWLGCVVESGLVLLLSCEEPEQNIRDRIERICRQRCIDPHAIENLHLYFPDLESTWLASADNSGRITKTPLLKRLEEWIASNKPRLVVIDSVAAVFDGEAVSRRQVRGFLGMLRKIARDHDTAIVLLDHPSVRGMSDGSGTANSVDWRNSVRTMLHLSDPDREGQDVRQLEVKKNNYGRSGEKVTLRWTGLTFVTDNLGAGSPIGPQRSGTSMTCSFACSISATRRDARCGQARVGDMRLQSSLGVQKPPT